MKPLLALMAVIATLGVLLLAPLSKASDLEKLYPERLTQAKNAYQFANAYFNGTGKLAEEHRLTPKMVKSRLRQEQLYQTWRVIALAIDAGYDISALAEFGIIRSGKNYLINFKAFPQWANSESLFRHISRPDNLNNINRELRQKGFNEIELMMLINYVSSHSTNLFNIKSELEQITPYLNEGDTTISSPLPASKILRLLEASDRSNDAKWDRWSTDLLNLFSQQKQRILIDYLQDKLGARSVMPYPMTEDSLKHYGDNLLNGKRMTIIQNAFALEHQEIK